MKDFLRKIEQTISRHNMLEYGDRVLVAVSGGPDSVVLLDVLDRLKGTFSLDLVVAHFDHSLRPEDDARETRFVASLAASKNLPFMTQKALSSPAKSGKSLEEEA
ncbi:MAG: tRNA(Ile)-lysidine synthetase, partial [Deltaproteobacteria bacterium]|nr:tRNA(Ile)-lysidine synthetase [Deltaproteobacteria bacterium]